MWPWEYVLPFSAVNQKPDPEGPVWSPTVIVELTPIRLSPLSAMAVSITVSLLWRFNTKWYSGRERCEALAIVSCLINVCGTDFQVHRASIFHTTYRVRLLTSPCTPGHLLPTPSGNRPYPTHLLPSTRNKPELSVLDRPLPSKSGQAVVDRKSRQSRGSGPLTAGLRDLLLTDTRTEFGPGGGAGVQGLFYGPTYLN